jgi:hypothetical protein
LNLESQEQNKQKKQAEKEHKEALDLASLQVAEREKQELIHYARLVEKEPWVNGHAEKTSPISPDSSRPSSAASVTSHPFGHAQAASPTAASEATAKPHPFHPLNGTKGHRPFARTTVPRLRKVLYGEEFSMRYNSRPHLDTGRRLGLY